MSLAAGLASVWPSLLGMGFTSGEGAKLPLGETEITSLLPAAGNDFGHAFELFDINGDGMDDLVVAEPGADVLGVKNAGRMSVLFGPDFGSGRSFASREPSPEELMGCFTITAITSGPGIGDANGDGHWDILAPAPTYDEAGYTSVGRAHLFFGPDFRREHVFHDPDPRAFGVMGQAVLLMDVNGDGLDDVLLGGPQLNEGDPTTGRVLVWDSRDYERPPRVLVPRDIGFNPSNAHFGRALRRGDIDGDGVDELLVSAPRMLFVGSGRGYVFAYSVPGLGLKQIIDTPDPEDHPFYFQFDQLLGFGDVIHTGDLSGDGVPDLLVTAPQTLHGPAPSTEGLVVRVDGPGFDYAGSIVPPELFGQKQFGLSSAAVDLDLDGHIDVIAGDAQWDFGFQGQAYVFWGPEWDEHQALNDLEEPLSYYGEFIRTGDSDADGWPEAYVYTAGTPGVSFGRVYRYEVVTVSSSAPSVKSGEVVRVDFNLGASRANQLFLALPSLSGERPGYLLPSDLRLSLNLDAATNAARRIGWLDEEGEASLELSLSHQGHPGLAGCAVTIGALTLSEDGFLMPASNAVEIRLEP